MTINPRITTSQIIHSSANDYNIVGYSYIIQVAIWITSNIAVKSLTIIHNIDNNNNTIVALVCSVLYITVTIVASTAATGGCTSSADVAAGNRHLTGNTAKLRRLCSDDVSTVENVNWKKNTHTLKGYKVSWRQRYCIHTNILDIAEETAMVNNVGTGNFWFLFWRHGHQTTADCNTLPMRMSTLIACIIKQ